MEQASNETLLPIRVVGELPTVESLVIAEGLGVKHKNLLDTIREHRAAIEADFGIIAFETRKLPDHDRPGSTKAGRPVTIAHLTEDQALFIGTLSRNSKQVVAFKKVLVKSFADSRRQERTTPVTLSTEQRLIQLMEQSQQLLAGQGELIEQLRTDLDSVMNETRPVSPGVAPHRRNGQQLQVPGTSTTASLRQLISRRVNEYSEYWQCEPKDTWTHLYRRLFEHYGFNVHRVDRIGNESTLDIIERYGRLQNLYELVLIDLIYT